MRPRKTALTLAEHRAIGRRLYEIRTTVLLMSVWIDTTYHRERMHLPVRAEKRIDGVRSRLDDYVSAEHPALPNRECCEVYYPGALMDHEAERDRWRAWTVASAGEALRRMARELRGQADHLFPAYPVVLGDRLLRAADELEATAINLPDWPAKRRVLRLLGTKGGAH
jgi:hypothetical protein